MQQKKSVSLVEVVVAAIILSMAFGGLFAAFIAARSYRTYSNERTIASNLARRALEDLYDGVSADNWDTGGLAVTPAGSPMNDMNYDIDDVRYDGAWDVGSVAGFQYRRVDMGISYTTQSGGASGGGTGTGGGT